MESDNDNTRTYIALTKGTMVSHYHIEKRIGAGGMGEVYLAEDTSLHRRVALKFLSSQYIADKDFKTRFVREAEAAALLNHPNIITIHEVSEFQSRPYIVMEYVDGQSLQDIIKTELSAREAIDIVTQICEGLKEAHGAGIIHRDVKPSNILIDKNNRVKILDFGLAKLAGSSNLTKTGSTLGTIAYMSPEQAQGKEVDQRSDLFSVGALLYEILTGKSPFKSDSDASTINAVVNETPEPLARYKSSIPEELQRIVSNLLQKDPSLRYQTAAGVIADLKRLSLSGESLITPVIKKNKTNRMLIGAVVILLFVIGAGLFFKLFVTGDEKISSDRKMLAVLPFENLGLAEDEYFADGITEEILTNLAKLSGLGVISRSSTQQYKKREKSLREIGKELGVGYILEGTIQWDKTREKTRVRIHPQLIRVSDDVHLWADRYDAVVSDIFEVQTTIAEKVAEALNIVLLEPERQAIEKKLTDNLEAYDYYLRGNEYFDPMAWDDKAALKLAGQLYRHAIDLDSNFALAYAKLSRTYTELYWHHEQYEEILNKAKETLDKALNLNPQLAEAHIALGSYYYHNYEYDNAMKEFEIALQTMPNNSVLFMEIGYTRRRQGKPELAISATKKAIELDPLSGVKAYQLGITYLWIREYDKAEPYYNRAISLAPEWEHSYADKAWLQILRDGNVEAALDILQKTPEMVDWTGSTSYIRGIIYASAGNYEKALNAFTLEDYSIPAGNFYLRAAIYGLMGEDELERQYYDSARIILEQRIASGKDNASIRSSLGITYAGLKRKKEAIREGELSQQMAPISQNAIFNPIITINLAMIYTMVGEYDKAIDQLELLLSVSSSVSISTIQVEPFWIPLRNHPRFQKLIEKYGEKHGT